MRRRDHAGGLCELPMERLQVGSDAMHIGKAVQIDERLATAGFDHRNLAALDIKRSHAAFDCLNNSGCTL
jgi:hypothetical protein